MSDVKALKSPQLETEIRYALSGPDSQMRERVEALSAHHAFRSFTWLWGPYLYKRDRVLYRPFILANFDIFQWKGGFSWSPAAFSKNGLDEWLEDADRADDLELTHRLLRWKLNEKANWKWEGLRLEFLRELRTRCLGQVALTSARLKIELSKLEGLGVLDEDTAIALYQRHGKAIADFLLRHCQRDTQGRMWDRLLKLVRNHESLYWSVYRRQVDRVRWEKDLGELMRAGLTDGELCLELKLRHPDQHLDVSGGFLKLLEARGRGVFPYLVPRVAQVMRRWFGGGGLGALLNLARQRGWNDLWALLVRTCTNSSEYNKELRALLTRRPNDLREQLKLLAGEGRQFNYGPFAVSLVQRLEDATALQLYSYDRDLVRTAFKVNLLVPPWNKGYLKFIELLISHRDAGLLDFLASRYALHPTSSPELELLYQTYAELKDSPLFSLRAANVLAQIPAYAIYNYPQLIRENRLARLFFERSARDYLDHPRAVAELVEANSIYAQALAYRVLGLEDERARVLARDHLPLLVATLLRPLQRATRLLAFRALANAARHDVESARWVLEQAREAYHLPEQGYPKDKLIGLIGTILQRWPELQGERERPVVYRSAS